MKAVKFMKDRSPKRIRVRGSSGKPRELLEKAFLRELHVLHGGSPVPTI
jgi:hypothetical protein